MCMLEKAYPGQVRIPWKMSYVIPSLGAACEVESEEKEGVLKATIVLQHLLNEGRILTTDAHTQALSFLSFAGPQDVHSVEGQRNNNDYHS